MRDTLDDKPAQRRDWRSIGADGELRLKAGQQMRAPFPVVATVGREA
jgi:hypothetical protein